MRGSPGHLLRDLAIAAAAAVTIGLTRAPVAGMHERVRETSDVYVLPPPDEVVTLSLGYRAAVADLLWAHVLVSQGLHTLQKRRFENLTRLLDTINELDPTYRDPYLLADALITFQANKVFREDVVRAREIMERGVKNRPLDADLWLALGQFVAFIAPASYLDDPDEQEEWRAAGARYLARAAELGGENANVSWQALGGVGILNRAGERDAAIRFLRRTLAVTDDEELKERINKQLEALVGEGQVEAYRRRARRFETIWRGHLPFASRAMIDVLGPRADPAWCAGGERDDDARCALTWRAWAERIERSEPAAN